MTLVGTLDSFNLFRLSVPSFYVDGRTSVSSLSGGIMTMALLALMLLYASIKFVHLMSRHNP